MKKHWLVFAFFFFLSFTVRAQYVFNNLQAKDGLSANEIISIHKDREGFVWLGTSNGLNRYDGSAFKIFNRRNKNSNNLASETITTITEYGDGKIFTGNPLGLSFYDKQKGTFTAVPFFTEKNEPIKELRVEKLLMAPGNTLWIFTWKGVFIYKDGKAVPAGSLFPATKPLSGKIFVTSACQLDTIHTGIWMGSTMGLYFFNYATAELFSASHNPRHWPVLTNTSVESLSIDKKGNLWVSSRSFFLGYFDFVTNTVSNIDQVIVNQKIIKIDNTVHRLFVDSKDRLWISSWLYKVFVREPNDHYIGLPEQSPELYKLGYGFFNDINEDREGNIWVGTLNGLSKLSAKNPLINLYQLPDAIQGEVRLINSFKKISKEEWMVAKDDGLFIFNEQTGKTNHYFIKNADLRGSRIFTTKKIGDKWWCGTGRGIFIFDPVSKTFSPFVHYPGNKQVQHSVTWIHQDRQQNIWYAIWGEAICRYNPQTGESIRFDGTDTKYGDVGKINAMCIMEDRKGLLWFGYGDKGLRNFDYNTGLFSKPANRGNCLSGLDQMTVSGMLEDADGNVWLATGGKGILKTDGKGNCLDSLTTENGLSSNSVVNLLMDSYGVMWAATPEGLHFFRPGDKNISKVDIDIQLPLGDASNFFEADNGKLYVSLMNRLAVLDIYRTGKKGENLLPIITGISVFGKDIPYAGESPELRFTYKQNFFTVEFSSPQHREFSSLQYAYKLEGFDKDWVYCGRRQTAAYTNVPGGKYKFLVKCTDANGQWTDSSKSISIHIRPPFWKTTWFTLLFLVLLAASASWVYQLFRQRSNKKSIDKTIDYFANSVYGENSVNEICWDIARNCISQLQFEDCVVYLLDEKNSQLVQKAAYGPKNPKGHEIINPVEIQVGKGIVGAVAATGKPLLINDTSKDERYIIDDEQRFSELAVPILHDNKVIGVIDSEHSRKYFFTNEHLKAMTTIASISSNKIAEAQAEAYAKENEIKLLEINKMLAESQLMALRAQMNPHFVFNCLNSIQECIVTQKYGEASKYLNKFSKLFRMVLNNSGRNLISIEEEKEVLELYMELEQMRFEKSFTYEMKIDEDLEIEEILIPSMLLQPYVENALWHGLMHKEGARELIIRFEKVNEDVFRCTIDDNGIGRKKSFALKEEQSKTKRHESKGLKISKDRIDVLQRQGYHATLAIIDKEDADGNAGGTTIIIELSTFLKS
ncbi:MAG: two-component regulator propeller domain-containing protein [Bacteroidota bacterium]|nr:two-component regulator propeller domain-containing protein [Bacteroidota bacterium]